MNRGRVEKLVNEALEENPSLFLIDLSISSANKIKVTIDGDNGVPLSECIRVSRNVEHNLDREEEDFSLEVTSPDIAEPLRFQRQYIKNIDKILKVKTVESSFEGTLKKVTEEAISLEWKSREKKPVGKGKITVTHQVVITLEDIIEAKVKIVF